MTTYSLLRCLVCKYASAGAISSSVGSAGALLDLFIFLGPVPMENRRLFLMESTSLFVLGVRLKYGKVSG